MPMANIFIFGVSLLGSLYLARKRLLYPFILLLIPVSLLLFSGYDVRLWGLGSGLAVLMLGRMVRGKLKLPTIFDLFPLILAGALAYSFGFRIEFVTNPAGGFFYLNWLSLPLTLAWIIVVTHSLGFLGAKDTGKLILKVATVACLAFLAIDLLQDQPLSFAISLVLATLGVLGGVLFSSVNMPALSQGLGFLIALLSIAGLLKATVSLALLAPIIILGVPLLTTNYAIAYGRQVRLPAPMNFFLKRGYSRNGAIFLIYLLASYLSISLAFLAKFMSFYSLGLILGLAALGGAILLRGERLLADGFAADASKINLLGTPIDRVNLVEAAEKMEELMSRKSCSLVFTPDTTAVMRARWDRELKDAYWKADLVTADGMGLVWASKVLGAPLPERVAGIDLIYEFCRRVHEGGLNLKLFLLGARPGTAEEAGRKLKQEFPKLQIVGTHHGYFHNDTEIIKRIRESAPDILLVGMGVPKQELWILKNKDKLNVSLTIGVGGSFDVISGRIPRAPKILQRAGLEWFYRLLQEPRRLGRTRLILIFIFKALLVKALQGLR